VRRSGLEELREQRDEVNRSLMRFDEEKGRLTRDLVMIQQRLAELQGEMGKDAAHRDELDTTIRESENALLKIEESSSTLLAVVQREQQSMASRLSSPGGERYITDSDAGASAASAAAYRMPYASPAHSAGQRTYGASAGYPADRSSHAWE
jgi:Sjoegren syndrome nuclear autoantigen 1